MVDQAESLFTKKEIIGFVLITVFGFVLTMVIWTIVKTDPYAETMTEACYPDNVVSWEKHKGNRLFVTCQNAKTKETRIVEVKRKK